MPTRAGLRLFASGTAKDMGYGRLLRLVYSPELGSFNERTGGPTLVLRPRIYLLNRVFAWSDGLPYAVFRSVGAGPTVR